ncbi:MerR family transcriptional regulator [Pseudonocardia sp. ICBG1293]|uniref:MerR family transcriptional regulator n=1 Tax=Pseudonocardia sp. ICBG1293 TaxID=2844382 RepID=UPI001CCE2D16|nr:MerR family transcriptional regulator [Pseudonocardia sp. ICBG1293]
MGLDRLDDPDYPAMAMGQAAELLDVEPAFLRSLDTAGVVHPLRSAGGHRRYSRRQLEQAARLRTLLDDGHPLGSASWIDRLRGELGQAHAEIERLRAELAALRTDDTSEQRP